MNLLNDVMDVVGGVSFEFDKNSLKVVYALSGSKIIAENVSFEELFEIIKGVKNYEAFDFSLDDFKNWLIDSNNRASYVFMMYTNGIKIKCSASKKEIDGLVICHIENLEKKKDMYDLIDSLTGAYQKSAFVHYVKSELEKENPRPFYMLNLDIDNFKTFNDTYGHMFGDKVLVEVSKHLVTVFNNGKVGRMGGDEFSVICFDSIEYKDIWNTLHDVCVYITTDISAKLDCTIPISISVGCVRYGIDGKNYDELYLKADKALYRGKKKGKNCFIIYDDEKHKNIHIDTMRRFVDRINDDGVNPTNFISMFYDLITKNEDFDVTMESILETIGKYFYADRIVYSVLDNNQEIVNKIWTSEQYKEYNKLPSIMPIKVWDIHKENGLVKMQNTENIIEFNSDLYKILNDQNVKSVVRADISYGDKIIGFLRIDSFSLRYWPIEEDELYRIVAKIISTYVYKANERKILQDSLYLDKLTGLYNYSAFIKVASEILANTNKKMCLYYLNFDKFKIINNHYSFKAGDLTLVEVSKALNDIYGTANSCIARYGDRFIVLTDYISKEDIDEKFTKLIKTKDEIFYEGKRLAAHIHLVTGVYITNGDELEITSIIDKANLARKSIEDVNRTSYAIYNEKMAQDHYKKNELESHFYEALNTDEFKIYLQPKIDMNTHKLIGAEALTRWYFKNEKIIQPIEFIPILESAGLISRLDFYVFEKVCQFLRNLIDKGFTPFTISINLSKKHIRNDYPATVERIRKKYNVDSKYIEIEITESLVSENTDLIIEIMSELHNLGYKISMDDFGSGYSNLSILSKFDFDVLKIDKSICLYVNDDKISLIISAIKSLTDGLGIDVLCEGVETEKQEKLLLSLGCNKAQGYLYDKPIAVDEFIKKYVDKKN